jgi:hypothetical protein
MVRLEIQPYEDADVEFVRLEPPIGETDVD